MAAAVGTDAEHGTSGPTAAVLSRATVELFAIGSLVSVGFVAAWGFLRVRPRANEPAGSPWPAIAASLSMPFFLPQAWVYTRIVVSVCAVTMAAKTWRLSRGAAADPAMLETLPRFLLWLVAPPESTWPRSRADIERARARGWDRLRRLALKAPGIAALMAVHLYVPGLHESRFVEAFWALWLCWLAVSAIADLVTCVPMLFGVDLEETFDAPPLARSPREFWGRRWNLFVHRFVVRFLFPALGGRRRPLLATLLVFVGSGLMHEYFVLACLGRPSAHTGSMLLFFTIQGLAVIAQTLLARRRPRPRTLPRPLAVTLHIAWLTLTGPLFFAPLGEIFASA